jgi:hypothetical protein
MSLNVRLPWALNDGGSSGSPAGNGWVPQLGVVASVDRNTGEITLVHRGGTWSCLTAHPSLLKDVREWGVVHVLTEGTVIRGLRCL